MDDNKIINDICWVAYFDILGFENILWYTREKTGSANLDVVARIYQKQIIREIEQSLKGQRTYTNVEMCHFCLSDSFVFFSPEDSSNSFLGIKYAAGLFFKRMIAPLGIPFRGSLTIGELYADMKENIFIGQGLIDAYKYAEKQDWIGLVLTPMAINKLSQMNSDLAQNLKDYVEYDVPVKETKGNTIIRETEKLFAYRISKEFENSICGMQNKARERYGKDYKFINKKYENILRFIKEPN